MQGNQERARELLVDLLASDPDDVDTLRLLAWLDASAGDTARAHDWIDLALALDPDPDTRLYFVNLLLESGDALGGIALAERQVEEVEEAIMLARSSRFAAVAGIALCLASCATNPATGEKEFSLMSEGQEISLGRESDPQIKAEMGVYDDAELQKYVSDLGTRLARVSERPDLP